MHRDINNYAITINDLARFWKHVNVRGDDECWPWISIHGKPRLTRPSFRIGGTSFSSAQISYLINNGKISHGHVVCHSCDNPICVNPTHLFSGTQSDNMKDACAKGRKSGPNTCLHNRENVSVLTRERMKKGVTIERLAFESNLSVATIRNLERGVGSPSTRTLIKLANALDCEVFALWRRLSRDA